ncbi:choline BCCT transporter BetT [Paraferrimonas sp. SM1919]|uniref:BCCT family transporter n=1 Tax=Paraferrimonas sp. SM1919 TaxID=2662263 RepID=UPI001969E71F|nr:choline BCCT transporter BetT [Paraferrimonas sp. SM1919]
MMTTISKKINPKVFYPSTLIIFTLLVWTLSAPEYAANIFNKVQGLIIENGSWFYVLSVAVILSFVIYLSVSRYGDIKLGPDHASPKYKLSTWISMLFAAGMGIGLMFFGVAEPVMHYLSPPTAEAGSLEAIKEAMKITFFHWGFHAWAIYAIVALILAYFSYRKGLPLTLRSALYPIIGDKIYGWPGHLVDIFAVVGTVFGVATSLGLGASQVNAGLNYLLQIEISTSNQLFIMIGIITMASVSVATGLDKGIKILSELNMLMAIMLLLLIFLLGPTVFLLQAYMQNIGAYLSDIVANTFNLFAYEKKSWIGGWTIFYWGWWLAWAPFVGLFIARISRGRTIREFVLGVLIVPTAFTLLWMTIFGNSAIFQMVDNGVLSIGEMVNENSAYGLFAFIETLPWATTLIGISILMIVVFFVTSCDSGAMVIDMLCSNGLSETPLWQRLFWAIAVGVVAATLTIAGGLQALQTMTIASALPFSIVLLIACFGLLRSLNLDSVKRDTLTLNPSAQAIHSSEHNWQQRLDNILSTPNKKNVESFIHGRVNKALVKVKNYFQTNDIDAQILSSDKGLSLKVAHGDEQDFLYLIRQSEHSQPEFNSDDNLDSYYRAEVHLGEGGQDYDIMGWSEEAIINDIVDQYQKHLHYLHLIRD